MPLHLHEDQHARPRSLIRSRSPSPRRDVAFSHTHRRRSPSPAQSDDVDHGHRRHRHRHYHARHRSSTTRKQTLSAVTAPAPVYLPFSSKPMTKHDLTSHQALFAMYLDIQKQLDIDALSDTERKGRWKRFISKWNAGQLAEGWYDPATKRRADEAFTDAPPTPPITHKQHASIATNNNNDNHDDDINNDGATPPSSPDSQIGPPLPTRTTTTTTSGPTPASFTDLADRDASLALDASNSHAASRATYAAERRLARDRLEAIAPRAEPGTRERMLEKRAETSAAARAYRDGGGAGDVPEVDEGALGLSGEGGTEEVRRMKREAERKRTEREVRREEVLRARQVEREERMGAVRAREQKTMDMLKALAEERFGGGGGKRGGGG